MDGPSRVPAYMVRVGLPTPAPAWAVVSCTPGHGTLDAREHVLQSALASYVAQWPCAVARAFLWAEQLGLHVPVDFSVRASRGADCGGPVSPAVRSLCVALEVAAATHDSSPSPVCSQSLLAAVVQDVSALTRDLRRADAMACPLPMEDGATAPATGPRGVAAAIRSLSAIFRMPAPTSRSGLAVVVWQPAFGILSMFVGRMFFEYGGPPWRVLFLRLDDAASVPFLPLWANPSEDLQRALSLATHLQVPFGLRCSYRLASSADASGCTPDCHLGPLLGRVRPRRGPRFPCVSWAGALEEDAGPLAPLMLLSSPDELVPRLPPPLAPGRRGHLPMVDWGPPRARSRAPPKKRPRWGSAQRRARRGPLTAQALLPP